MAELHGRSGSINPFLRNIRLFNVLNQVKGNGSIVETSNLAFRKTQSRKIFMPQKEVCKALLYNG